MHKPCVVAVPFGVMSKLISAHISYRHEHPCISMCRLPSIPGIELYTSFVQIQPIWRMGHTLLPYLGSRVRSMMQVESLHETFYAFVESVPCSVVLCTVLSSFKKCEMLFAAPLMVRIAIRLSTISLRSHFRRSCQPGSRRRC